jgi:ATP-dependent RNA helicase HelY
VVDEHGEVHEFEPADLTSPPERVGQVELPEPYLPDSVTFAYETAQELAKARTGSSKSRDRDRGKGKGKGRRRAPDRDGRNGRGRTGRGGRGGGSESFDGPMSRDEVDPKAHRALRRLDRLEADLAGALRSTGSGADTLGGRFDRVIELLSQRGHVVDWELTESGQRLARLYHESDLLIVEALQDGLFDDLAMPELVAMASVFVYQERRSSGGRLEPWYPSGELRHRFRRLQGRHLDLIGAEDDLRLPTTTAPDPGFMAVAHGWASGGGLVDVLADEEFTAGDFVRTAKQLIDLLRQLGKLSANPATAAAARAGADAVHRDLVAASSLVESDGP